jgi:hypothetical protein
VVVHAGGAVNLRLPVLLLLAAGCRRVDPAADAPTFVFDVEGPAVAGEPVPWSVSLRDGDGETLPVTATVISEEEASLTQDAETLTPTLAGLQHLTAVGDADGGAFRARATLEVEPADAVSIDLVLAANQAAAGEPLGFTVTAADAFGNAVTGATVTADSPDVAVVDPQVVSTVSGIYTLTAAVDAVSDDETFRVVPGEPVELSLTLSDTDVEVYDTTRASVTAWDTYGNEVDVDWDLSVEGEGSTTLSGYNVTFLSEGWFTVWARYEDLADSVGPILIDSTGPTITLESPERGLFTEDASTPVSGLLTDDWSGIGELTVDGVDVPVESDGSFSTSVDNTFGMNVLELVAVDGDENPTSDTRARLYGDFLPYGDADTDGVLARINEPGFDALEVLGEGLIEGQDLAGLIPSPAYSTSSESCVDVIFDEVCITWYSVELTLSNPSIGETDLELDPDAGGWINATFTVYDPYIDWGADGTVLGIGMSGDGSISADSITIDMDLLPSVDAGVLSVSVLSADVSSSNFVFDWDSWLYDVMDFFGLDLSSLVQGYLEDAIEGVIQDDFPSMLADALADLEIASDLDLGTTTATFAAEPSSVAVDDRGLTLGLATTFTLAEWQHDETGPGSLYGAYTTPTYGTSASGMQVSLSLDFLNQALYGMWGAGLLDQDLGEADLGLDLGSLGSFLPFDSLAIETHALLPPQVVPGTGDAMLDLHLGDLGLTLRDGETGDVVFEVYASLVAGLDLDVADGTLSPAIGDTTIWFDVVVPAAGTEASADAEALLDALVPLLLPTLTEGLSTIPLPDISGFGLTINGIALDGAESGYATIDGDLSFE